MAEGVGFEPTVHLREQRCSRPSQSTALSSFRRGHNIEREGDKQSLSQNLPNRKKCPPLASIKLNDGFRYVEETEEKTKLYIFKFFVKIPCNLIYIPIACPLMLCRLF